MSDAKPAMQLERVAIDALTVDPANVRGHSGRNLEAIAASLRAFGQQRPIVVDRDGVVIAGNGTLLAARQLGWTHIDVVRSSLEGAQRMAYAIADNRTAELAHWEEELREQLAALREDTAIDATVTGFSEAEIDRQLGRLAEDVEGAAEQDPGVGWIVLVECDSEAQQLEVIDQLQRDGLKCRALV